MTMLVVTKTIYFRATPKLCAQTSKRGNCPQCESKRLYIV